MDRLTIAWRAWLALSRSERHEFLRRLKDWQEERRGGAPRGPAPKVQQLADVLAKISL